MPTISSFKAAGNGLPHVVNGEAGWFNVDLSGTFAAEMGLERSLDGGSTWQPISLDASGAEAVFFNPVSFTAFEPQPGAIWRWVCNSYTSGTVTARIHP